MRVNSLYYLYSCVMFLLITVSAQAQQERKVAVFDPAGKVDEALLEIVREEISSVVVNTSGYTVLERQLINKVLEENRFQESGLVNDEQMSDIGKRMGADYVFVTAISRLGTNYYISCKMIEVSTARIEKQSTGTTTKGINDIPQTTQSIVKRLFVDNVQQQAINRQPQQKIIQNSENQIDKTSSRQQSMPAEVHHSLPVSSNKTTIRKGFEIQGDVMCLNLQYRYGSGFRAGANFSTIYRFKPKFALGIGFGSVSGASPTQTWNPFFLNIIYNFTESNLSPYIALEMGVDRYPLRFDYYDIISSGFSIGLVSGFQCSINDHFALITYIKGSAITNHDNAYKIGIGVGLIYHF